MLFMEAKSKFRSELIFKSFLPLLGLVISIVSIQYGLGTIQQPGAGVFTLFLGLLILIFGIIDIVFAEKKLGDDEPLFGDNNEVRKFLSLGFTLIIWIIGMPYLGYIIMIFVVTFLIAKIMELEGWFKPIILSIVTTSFIYLLFDLWLFIDLPRGIFG
jgi:hypothetical protein